jgi:hypothetical protein
MNANSDPARTEFALGASAGIGGALPRWTGCGSNKRARPSCDRPSALDQRNATPAALLTGVRTRKRDCGRRRIVCAIISLNFVPISRLLQRPPIQPNLALGTPHRGFARVDPLFNAVQLLQPVVATPCTRMTGWPLSVAFVLSTSDWLAASRMSLD